MPASRPVIYLNIMNNELDRIISVPKDRFKQGKFYIIHAKQQE
jgi:hypothetical protein